MKEKHISVQIYLSLWMIGVAALGLWPSVAWPLTWTNRAADMILPVFCGLVGIAGLLSCLHSRQKYVIDLHTPLGVYNHAWQALWKRKWILGLFGTVALANAVGVLVTAWTSGYLYRAVSHGRPDIPSSSMQEPLSQLAVRGLHAGNSGLQSSFLDWIFPGSGVGGRGTATLIAGLFLVIAFLLVRKQVREALDQPEYSRGARMLLGLMLPFGIVTIAYVLGSAVLEYKLIAAYLRKPEPRAIFQWPVGMYVVDRVYALTLATLINSLVISALVGSMQRVIAGKAVGVGTMVRDSLRYLVPLAVLYLVLSLVPWFAKGIRQYYDIAPMNARPEWIAWLWQIETIWKFLLPLVLFAPYAVTRECRVGPILAAALRQAAGHRREVAAFLAVGYSLVALPLILLYGGETMCGGRTFWAQTPIGLANVLAAGVGTAFFVLAVWGQFRRTSDQ